MMTSEKLSWVNYPFHGQGGIVLGGDSLALEQRASASLTYFIFYSSTLTA